MIYPKGSIDYEINREALRELEEMIPMTSLERSRIREWVMSGHEMETNPFRLCELDGSEMNYLKAYRIYYGASHGYWDSWEYSAYIKRKKKRRKHPNFEEDFVE